MTTERNGQDEHKEDIELLYALWATAQEYEEARLERNQLIRECLERGISPTRISESAGISKAAIYRYKEN